MKNHKILLSLGSNLGKEESTIFQALDLLITNNEITIDNISSIYKTEPLGLSNQKWYTNIAASGTTTLSEIELLYFCKSIEYLLGRKSRTRWSEREIDIDILFYGNSVFSSKYLTIPHKELHLRNFVLEPLAEIEPDFVHPLISKSIISILENTPDNLLVVKSQTNT
ncbi:MAG: 2-amino-4-hydroxy-6-hydroxymethyldihydropteridine diphosphokinase [Ignavibacteria bacterium GWF2_33_9]|nr:MAG: 2-amino-4-hydroxy-6-hydroxymethyldihydropteridine diphosphokinase [Ignavibacteria bacterium GWF2_33_9]